MRIEVAPIPGGYVAYLLEDPQCWAAGELKEEAVGLLISEYSEIFGIEVDLLTWIGSAEEAVERGEREKDERRDIKLGGPSGSDGCDGVEALTKSCGLADTGKATEGGSRCFVGTDA